MSHGANDVGEPNLTPLLDLVLQLLMFFLIVANFVLEQSNQDIKLPEATTAVPIDTDVKNILALNIDQDGKLVLSGSGKGEEAKLDSEGSIRQYLNDQYAFSKRDGGEQVVAKMAVVIRGDSRANFEQIYRVMRAAKDAGFVNVQLRANRHSPNG
jgi:biopolymer transport protein ExbD